MSLALPYGRMKRTRLGLQSLSWLPCVGCTNRSSQIVPCKPLKCVRVGTDCRMCNGLRLVLVESLVACDSNSNSNSNSNSRSKSNSISISNSNIIVVVTAIARKKTVSDLLLQLRVCYRKQNYNDG